MAQAGSRLSEREQGLIDAYRASGKTLKEIALLLSRSRSAVHRYTKSETYQPGHEILGRRKILDNHDVLAIKREGSLEGSSLSKIKHACNLSCSRATIANTLHEASFVYSKMAKVPSLSQNHKIARLDWSNLRSTWLPEWQRCIFSDEKKFNLDGPDGCKFYWHHVDAERRTFVKRHTGGGSVFIWAAIGWHRKSRLYFFDETLNADNYQAILSLALADNLESLADLPTIFQQDNAPCHAARSTKAWFRERNIELLPWPSNSPDLNPIENCWGHLAKKVYVGGRQFYSKEALKLAIQDEWDKLDQRYIQDLILSMSNRVDEVIAKRGDVTHY